MKIKHSNLTLTALLFALWCFAVPAFAVNLAQAKAAGQVGEQMDGYLGLVGSGASADVKALVNSINAQRRAEYQRIAAKNGVPVAEVAKMTAQKVMGQAAPGHYIQTPSGWQKR